MVNTWLSCCLAEWLDVRLTGSLSRWPTKLIRDRLDGYQVGYNTRWLKNWLDVRQTGWLAKWMASKITYLLAGLLNTWLHGWLIGWMLD